MWVNISYLILHCDSSPVFGYLQKQERFILYWQYYIFSLVNSYDCISVFESNKTTELNLRDYDDYEKCVGSLIQTCPIGTRMVYEFDSRLRTYVMKLRHICPMDNNCIYIFLFLGVYLSRSLIRL